MFKKRRVERWRREDGGHADKEVSQLGEQAENGITLCFACFSVSVPSEG